MQDNAEDADARRWLVGPPGPNEAAFELRSGDQAEVTPEVRAAIEQLLKAVARSDEADDVSGYDCFGFKRGCGENEYICFGRASRNGEMQRLCFTDYRCVIGVAP